MFRFPELCMAMKEDAPGASHMDGKQTTLLLLTDSEIGNALEKQDGNSSQKKTLNYRGLLFFLLNSRVFIEIFFNLVILGSIATPID
jgi:hypothetical protein